ncbi:hypothetical protein [Fluviispira vulneris]|uniref:hypothetical protein n=1 Tax=Fluviispira vulneris TaxID=2763012 RepID=UPI001644BD1D|nr:hypothetical protein [Fluviispira vulneris]
MIRFLSIFFIILFISSCKKPDSTYYTINQVRVVAVLMQSTAPFTGTTSQTSTQQMPNRPGCTATDLYFVVISPTNETPTMTIDSLKIAPIGFYYLAKGGGGRGLPNGISGTSLSLSAVFTGGSSTPTTTTNVLTSPFRLTVFTYPLNCAALTVGNLQANVTQVKDIPAFMINYTATSGVSSDKGFYTFYFLPTKGDAFWSSTDVEAVTSQAKRDSIQNGLAVTNNPSQFGTLSPIANSTINANSDNTISAPVTIPSVPTGRDANSSLFQASTRIQWYVSSGSLDLDTASTTTWNPETTAGTSVGGVVVVRDLLGGVDFKIFGPFTTQ